MEQADQFACLYGTAEPPHALREVQVGPLTFLYGPEAIRRISWHGTELVRAIAWPIRDESWGTYAPELIEEIVDPDAFKADLKFSVADGRLVCDLSISADANGEIQADLTLTPVGQPFPTNRAGFTVLHPIKGTAGEPLRVQHSDGAVEDTRFPQHISPDQPVMDISGLSYAVGNARVDITFEGEVFEMEDQRNWSDASYKTYCVPLVHPFTYTLDRPVTQSIRMSFKGPAAQETGAGDTWQLNTKSTSATAPGLGLVLQDGWLPNGSFPQIGASHLLLRMSPDSTDLAATAAFAAQQGAEVDVEIILAENEAVEAGLQRASNALDRAGLVPNRVFALPAGYLDSHQPSGPWPEGPTPDDMCRAARAVFPDARIGGGAMTNFTEFNRCRPNPALCDFITHANTSIVHAGDDLSVVETLETLPQVFESAESVSGDLPYRLGLVSIGMRSNPYGADVADNAQQVRRTMARIDPRHRGLFGAAWAVGVLAATAKSRVEAICLAAPTGPFGLLHQHQSYPQAGYDGEDRVVYPLFHVVREACAMAGGNRLAVSGLPDTVVAYGARRDGVCRLMIANILNEAQQVALPQPSSVAILGTESFDTATRDQNWLDQPGRDVLSDLRLDPLSVAFAQWEG